MASANTTAGFNIKVSIQTAPNVFTEFKNAYELGLAVENEKDQWVSFGEDGWKSAAITAKNMTAALKIKRTLDDVASDYVSTIAKGSVNEQNNQVIKLEFPLTPDEVTAGKTTGETWEIPCVIEIGSLVGSAQDLQEYELTATSDGKPTFQPAQ